MGVSGRAVTAHKMYFIILFKSKNAINSVKFMVTIPHIKPSALILDHFRLVIKGSRVRFSMWPQNCSKVQTKYWFGCLYKQYVLSFITLLLHMDVTPKYTKRNQVVTFCLPECLLFHREAKIKFS